MLFAFCSDLHCLTCSSFLNVVRLVFVLDEFSILVFNALHLIFYRGGEQPRKQQRRRNEMRGSKLSALVETVLQRGEFHIDLDASVQQEDPWLPTATRLEPCLEDGDRNDDREDGVARIGLRQNNLSQNGYGAEGRSACSQAHSVKIRQGKVSRSRSAPGQPLNP